jgi:hypothetical protein
VATLVDLVPLEGDEPGFLLLAQRIINGAVAALQANEVFLVQVDNWFDRKWFGWGSKWRYREVAELRVPLFTPNRVRSERRFSWDSETSVWTANAPAKPLHIHQPGRGHLASPLERVSEHAVFVWYSGNTATNMIGSLMAYLSGAQGYACYASFRNDGRWASADTLKITQQELISFEARGRQMESAPVHSQ